MKRQRIGITIGLHRPDETLWNNGIKQNAVFLADALRHCPSVASVVLVNTTSVPLTSALPWDLSRHPTLDFNDAKDQLDLVIELGGQVDSARTEYLKARGVRLVSYCCGFEYIHAAEAMIFGKSLWGGNLFVNDRYDDLWVIPQVAGNSQSYLEVMRRQSGRIVPFVWSPEFIEARSREFPHNGIYRPHVGSRRLTVMEPNIDVVKFCLYPILIAELVYRERPGAIDLVQVANALSLAQGHVDFIALMNQLDIVREHKAVFTGHHDTPTFLAQNTDIVISHQMENPLNYFYLEVCWQGYPLVHNASLCPDLGYYYEGNNAQRGAARLIEAIDYHDLHVESYRTWQRRLIGRYAPGNRAVVRTYQALLDQLLSRPVRGASA
ncbi:MAG: DUF2827 domain-containing protein [Paraburkholderia sp.]|uniref:DUF2827 domain-containing protein n=1 Tax=Paraburkholderia sp. TaxID=1926495 RepID=UPI001215D199|nr:DUF2827 domain-containing protein [Paraburkholderia sp.]TAM01520.1 MAG: DUF2827 domain-containing protein [Paraburkholderia sp.]TAM28646.1 MAG: DUF2827 domain-containing protein [Paraburkholderia sp.]